MRPLRIGFTVVPLCALSAALGGCGAGSNGPVVQQVAEKSVHRAGFSHPTTIDNRWFPLVPGTQFVLVGRVTEGHKRFPHRVVFTVTDLTKVIDGVRTLVLWDRDYSGKRLQEGELTFHAQDDAGNVWNFGEYPEEYEHGKFAGAPDTWIAGLASATAGIVMPGHPRVGTPSYLQGWAPAIEFADRARVYRTGLKNCVPAGCYHDVLVTDEWTPAEPGAHQRKYYAPGVGNIRVGAVGGKDQEGLVLTKVVRLRPHAVAEVRRRALKLDSRAYRARKSLYGQTQPAEHTLRAGREE